MMETLIEKNIYESIIKVKGKKKLEVNEPSLNIKTISFLNLAIKKNELS